MLQKEIIKRTYRVPQIPQTSSGNSHKLVRQLDIALLSVGFKMSADLMKYLANAAPINIKDSTKDILAATKELVGDHVKHNVYFKKFPAEVPDTEEFWLECLIDAMKDVGARSRVMVSLAAFGTINLLDLPKYGRYQHTYEEMLEAQEQFIYSAKDRITVLHLGKTLRDEGNALYHSLAESAIPLNPDDLLVLEELAETFVDDIQPERIPIRENKAVINKIRILNERPLLTDTYTDVLRLACALSDGDVTLQTPTKFNSFPRYIRRSLLAELDKLPLKKLPDIPQYAEVWKRLGERLHPNEYRFRNAWEVFAVARKDKQVQSIQGKIEKAFVSGNVHKAIEMLSVFPGQLFRNLDRILQRIAAGKRAKTKLLAAINNTIDKVSGRVVLSVREHLYNRTQSSNSARIFANSKGTSWVMEDTREPLQDTTVKNVSEILDNAIRKRLPKVGHLVMDRDMCTIAMPLSTKTKATGFNSMPRGSVVPIHSEWIRFFMYWKEKNRRTDYDLSVIALDADFKMTHQVSYTNLREGQWKHSGDITGAAKGASEFIEVHLPSTDCKYIVPQVNIYAGESFETVEESFFGFMERDKAQKGKPFEPRTVKMKSDLRGKGKIALPLMFFLDDVDNIWKAKWLNLYVNGYPAFNRVENNRFSTALLAKSIISREYMPISHIVGLIETKKFSWYSGQKFKEPVTFIGVEAPEGLPEGSKIFTLSNLHELCPK